MNDVENNLMKDEEIEEIMKFLIEDIKETAKIQLDIKHKITNEIRKENIEDSDEEERKGLEKYFADSEYTIKLTKK
jgi:hypothetical protein